MIKKEVVPSNFEVIFSPQKKYTNRDFFQYPLFNIEHHFQSYPVSNIMYAFIMYNLISLDFSYRNVM